MSEHIPLGSGPEGYTPERLRVRQMIEHHQQALLDKGFNLFDKQELTAIEDVFMARTSNPQVSTEDLQAIHPRAAEVLSIVESDDQGPTPAGPAAAPEIDWNQPPANDNDRPMDMAA